jgi:predicted nucleotidyltransferase
LWIGSIGDVIVLTIDTIQEKVTGVVRNFNSTSTDDKVDKVLLFGSYASGQAKEGSDVDLLIEFNSTFVSFLSLGRLLAEFEEALAVSVDVVASPLPENSIISIETTVPLYAEN